MKIAVPISVLLAAGAASANGANPPRLEGATPVAGKQDARYNTHVFDEEELHIHPLGGPTLMTTLSSSAAEDGAANAGSGGYEYYLSINTTLPLQYDYQGKPEMNKCVEWPTWTDNSNGSNFTWYGLRIMLPDDATIGSGGRYTYVTRATIPLGWAQEYGSAPATVLGYNFTTKESQPLIRINFNDRPFEDTYRYDFVDKSGSSVSDDGSYQEFNTTLNGNVFCYANTCPDKTNCSQQRVVPVVPTMTVSLKRFDTPPPPTPPSPGPSSAADAPRVKLFGLGIAAVATAGSFL